MEVDHMSKGKSKATAKAKAMGRSSTAKTKSVACAEREGTSRETVGHEQTETEPAIENVVKDVSQGQSVCEVNEGGLVIDSGASVNVGPKWFAESSRQE